MFMSHDSSPLNGAVKGSLNQFTFAEIIGLINIKVAHFMVYTG